MKKKEKIFLFFIPILLVCLGVFFASMQEVTYQFDSEVRYEKQKTTDLSDKRIVAGKDFQDQVKKNVYGFTNYRNKTMEISDDFTSNLPVVVLDTNGKEPKRSVVWDSEKDYYVPIEGDPYTYGEMKIYDTKEEGGVNTLQDTPRKQTDMKIKLRGNSSGNYDKKQYLIKTEKKENILGLGKDSDWILNVSFIDKSLIRNKLAYEAASSFMPYVSDSQYCEVVWKNGDKYYYQGLYLMMESVKVGKDRVDLPTAYENVEHPAALIRRDRYNPNQVMLENYGTKTKQTDNYLGLEYPKKEDASPATIQKITDQIDKFEAALFDPDYKKMIQYRDYIDVQSFVDYFIMNEYFMNYDAGYNSTYMYMDYTGKIHMGPVWDFDQCLANDAFYVTKYDTTAMHSAPWFKQMLRDPIFTQQIIERYQELRKSVLSDEAIVEEVENLVYHMGPAIERDWNRWGYFYENADYLQGPDTHTYSQELTRVVNLLQDHAHWLDEHLDSLYQFKDVSLEKAQEREEVKQKYNIKAGMAVIFVLVIFISVHLILRYEN